MIVKTKKPAGIPVMPEGDKRQKTVKGAGKYGRVR